MKKVLIALFALAILPGIAVAHDGGAPAGGPGGGGPAGRDGGFEGGALIVGSDGTVYVEKSTTSGTTTTHQLVAIRSTGTTAWTVTLSARSRVELSGTNLIEITDTTASGATSPSSSVTAIST